jgi:hypothetical protein
MIRTRLDRDSTSRDQDDRQGDHGSVSIEEDACRPMGRDEKGPATLRIWDPKEVAQGVEGDVTQGGTGVPRCAYQSIRSKSAIMMEDSLVFQSLSVG